MTASNASVRTAVGVCLVLASWGARADSVPDNVVGRIETHVQGERTTVVIHGSSTPSFTAYRLERPSRLVVDIANGKLAPDASKDGLIDVDSWAVSQISSGQYKSDQVKTARVMIGLKRGCTYDAKPKGNDLYVLITATDPAPANVSADASASAAQAREAVAAAEARRTQVLAQLADEEKRLSALRDARAEEERREKKQGDAQKAEAEANRRAEAARADADTAKARALAARAEVERLQVTRAAEEQKIAELQQKAAAGGSQAKQELSQLRIAADKEQARLSALKAEAEKLAVARTTELRRIDEAQAEARRAADRKQRTLEEARVLADQRAQDAVAQRLNEERRAQSQLEEAARLSAATQKLASSEDRQKSAEAAARRAGEQARADEARVAKLRTDAERIVQAAALARAQVEAARLETQQLVDTQAKERAKLESARLEAKRLADQRQLEMERAAHASAMISGERAKMEAAEQEAKKLADTRQKESLRLDAIRKAADEAAAMRADELRRIEDARTAQKATVAAHERELVLLAERRDRELKSLAEARAGEEAKIAAARDEVRKTRMELDSLEGRRAAQQSDADRARAELAALEQKRALDRSEADKARAELNMLEGKRLAQKSDADRTRAELAALEQKRAADKSDADRTRAELAALEQKRAADKSDADRTRAELAALESKRAMDKSEADKARAEIMTLEQQRASDRAAADSAKADAARARAELDARRAEQGGLEKKIAEARAELARAEERAKQAAAAAEAQKKLMAAAPAPAPVLDQHTKELARKGAPITSQVRDVRFADDADSHRIVIEMQGEPEWKTTPSQKGELTLSLKGADLPRRLERTLDTGAYKGPVRSVSTYTDPSDPGAVRVVVSIDPKAKGGEPKITKEGDRLVWEFPREARATSIAPTRVSGYGTSMPLQVASASTNLPPPAASRGRRMSYSGRRIDLDFKDFDIHNILRLLSDVGQVNIITSDDVKGTITIRMRDVPWDQALDVILKAKSLGMQREGNLIRVAPLSVLQKEQEAELAAAKASIELKPLDTRLIPLSYAKGEKMLPRVQELLSSRGKVSVDERTNMLIVSDVAANIALAEDLVRNLDTQTPQVMIEARIVEASQNFTRQVGIQWGGNTLNSAATGNPTGLVFPSTVGVAGAATDANAPTAGLQTAAANPNYVVNLPSAIGTGAGGGLGLTLGSLSGAYNINLRLSALEATGQVRIVSAPKVTTLDNVEASIESGTSIPISVVSAAGTNTVFVDAKLSLTVKPHVTNEGSVTMNVAVTRNEPDFSQTGSNGAPTITKRQAKTEMLIRDGDTAVIGGIYTRNTSVSYQKLPWVADIPILGWLFKNRSEIDDRTELLIFITPRIVNRQMVAR